MTLPDNSYTIPRADLKYAVLGAGGFVGTALVARLFRAGAPVAPVIRRMSTGSALLARFAVTQRVADVMDQTSLQTAFAGMDIVFHCVTGDRHAIVQGLKNSLAAAQAAGVRRFVYLSSAVVHGFHPSSAIDELSPFAPPPWSEYAKNKAEAEEVIGKWGGAPETVVLRPSIIYGPRSKDWSETPARQIASGTAYLVDQGCGRMNEVHITHLLDAMLLAAHHPAAKNQIYVLQDGFGRTWQDYYRSLCALLGVEFSTLAAFSSQEIARNSSTWARYWRWVRDTPAVLRGAVWQDPLKAWLKRAPGFEALRGAMPQRRKAPNEARLPGNPIAPDRSIALLHAYPQPLVDAKIRAQLGFSARLSREETIESLRPWYRFMGLAR